MGNGPKEHLNMIEPSLLINNLDPYLRADASSQFFGSNHFRSEQNSMRIVCQKAN